MQLPLVTMCGFSVPGTHMAWLNPSFSPTRWVSLSFSFIEDERESLKRELFAQGHIFMKGQGEHFKTPSPNSNFIICG